MQQKNLLLLKKLSHIHAYKCMITADWLVAVKSFETVTELKNEIINGKTEGIREKLVQYANEEPAYHISL